MEQLDPGGLGQHRRAGHCENDARHGYGRAKWRGLFFRPAPRGDGFENADHQEIRQQRGPAVTQEWRHHAGERRHAERAGGDQQKLQRGSHAQPGGQKEFIIRRGAQGDAQRPPYDKCVNAEDRGDSQEAAFLAQG